MQAIQVQTFGEPEVLRLQEVPTPVPGPGQVLVRIRAAGVNPVETYQRSGAYDPLPDLPYIPGSDGAGAIAAVGPDVEGLREGERVFVTRAATYAQYALCRPQQVHSLPDSLSFAQGAALGVPYLTALHALAVAGCRSGERLLVHGGSGGVGTGAIQAAVRVGALVAASAGTPEGKQLVLRLGARAAVGHGDCEAAEEALGGPLDVILEMAAHRNLGSDLRHLAPGGRVVVIGSRGPVEINPRDLMRCSGAIRAFQLPRLSEDALGRVERELARGLRDGSLCPAVGRTFPLALAPEAHRAVLEPGACGKIVLEVE